MYGALEGYGRPVWAWGLGYVTLFFWSFTRFLSQNPPDSPYPGLRQLSSSHSALFASYPASFSLSLSHYNSVCGLVGRGCLKSRVYVGIAAYPATFPSISCRILLCCQRHPSVSCLKRCFKLQARLFLAEFPRHWGLFRWRADSSHSMAAFVKMVCVSVCFCSVSILLLLLVIS